MLIRLTRARAHTKIMLNWMREKKNQTNWNSNYFFSVFYRSAYKCHETECGIAIVRPSAVHPTISLGRYCCGWFAIVRWWRLRERHLWWRLGQFADENIGKCVGCRRNRLIRTWMRRRRLASSLHESRIVRSMDSLPTETVTIETLAF